MSSTALADSRLVVRRIIRIEAITIGWMTIEAVFALGAAWRSHSPALLAFGGDSAIELLSAVVVYWRFPSSWSSEQTERLAARITGGFLFALAGYALVATLALLGHREVKPSLLFGPSLFRNSEQWSRKWTDARKTVDVPASRRQKWNYDIFLEVRWALWGVRGPYYNCDAASIDPDTLGCFHSQFPSSSLELTKQRCTSCSGDDRQIQLTTSGPL